MLAVAPPADPLRTRPAAAVKLVLSRPACAPQFPPSFRGNPEFSPQQPAQPIGPAVPDLVGATANPAACRAGSGRSDTGCGGSSSGRAQGTAGSSKRTRPYL